MIQALPRSGSVYKQIQNSLRNRIQGGEWAAGDPLPTRRSLAEEFGTTRITLDKAIAELSREGLLYSVPGSGTFVSAPDKAAQDDVPTATRRVGVLMGRSTYETHDSLSNGSTHFFSALFQGVRQEAAARGADVFFAYPHGRSYRSVIHETPADGWIVLAFGSGEFTDLRMLSQAGTPPFLLLSSSTAALGASFTGVDTDNGAAMELAVAHLTKLGHSRIGMVNLALENSHNLQRLQGFLDAMSRRRLSLDPAHLLFHPVYEFDHFNALVRLWATRLRRENNLPTALIVCNYEMTLATLAALRETGVCVPRDVSVVGFDDTFSAAHLSPPLTTIRQPLTQIGRRAVARLLDALTAGVALPDGMEYLPVELIVRSSTCPPRDDAALPFPHATNMDDAPSADAFFTNPLSFPVSTKE